MTRLGNRGVSTALSHVLAISITSALIVVFLLTTGSYIEEVRQQSVEQQVETVGNRVIVNLQRADGLITQSGTGTASDPVTVGFSLPSRVSGHPYTVSLRGGGPTAPADPVDCETDQFDASECVVISVSAVDVKKVFPLELSSQTFMTLDSKGDGQYVVAGWSNAGAAPFSSGSPVVEQTLQIGVGETYEAPPRTGGGDGGFNLPPNGEFSYAPGTPTSGEQTTFTANASQDSDGEIVAYKWDVDEDGVYERQGETISVELDAGMNNVTLLVVDDGLKRSTTTETVNATGLYYSDDVDVTSNDNVVEFKMTNEWQESRFDNTFNTLDLDQLFLKLIDSDIIELNAGNSGEIWIKPSQGGNWEVQKEYDWKGLPNSGRFFDISDESSPGGDNVQDGDEATFRLRGFDDSDPFDPEMQGERVEISIRYNINGTNPDSPTELTYVTTFTDVVGDADIWNVRTVRDSQDDEISLKFKSTNELEGGDSDQGIKANVTLRHLNGTIKDNSTYDANTITTGNNATFTCSPSGGIYTCELIVASDVDANAPSAQDGQYVVNLTSVYYDQAYTNNVSSSDPVVNSGFHLEGGYLWENRSDWDAYRTADQSVRPRGVVHDDETRDRSDARLRLGYPRFEQRRVTDVSNNKKLKPYLYYPLDERSGANVNDLTTILGEPNDVADGTIQNASNVIHDVIGLHGSSSYYFYGDEAIETDLSPSGPMSVPAELDGGPSANLTASLWFKPKWQSGGLTTGNKVLIGEEQSSNDRGWALVIRKTCPSGWGNVTCVGSGPYIGFASEQDGTKYGRFKGPISTNRWHHSALVFDGERMTIYLDGQQFYDATVPSDETESSSDTLLIGEEFNGKIDEVRLYNRTMPGGEVESNLYDVGTNGTLYTKYKTDQTLDHEDLTLNYQADIAPGQSITVVVETPSGRSAPIELEDGFNEAEITGLASDADQFRLIVTMNTTAPVNSPVLYKVQITDDSS